MDGEIKIYKIEPANKVFILAIFLVAGVLVFLGAKLIYSFATLPQNYPLEITSVGQGKVFAKPDIALVSIGVQTQGMKSNDVVTENNTKMNAITKAVKDLGVEEKDIQTTSYNLSPVYDYTERGRVFKGYSLNQAVNVKIRNFDKIGDILDKATALGANTVGDLQFTIDDQEKFMAEAREKAIAEAKTKAGNLATAAGLKIVKMVNISEGSNYTPQPVYGKGGGGVMAEFASVAPQIQPGQMEINATIYLTYRVR
ncbi:MAG: SIMPL domain-containing protein [Patescibacteria group bacterium]